MYKIAIISAFLILLIPLATSSFASTVLITFARASSDPHTALTFNPPASSAYVGDTLEFSNADNVPHSVTSGTPDIGPDGKFDSGIINFGQAFTYTLTSNDIGTLHFYDKTYPWMAGTVFVQEALSGYKVVHNVGADAGDGKTTYDVQYQSVKDIVSSAINPKDKSVNFVLVGKTDKNSDLVIRLPKGVADGPFLGIWEDNQQIKNFTITEQQDINLVTVPISNVTEQVSIVGTTVVPEFGPMAATILVLSIIAIVAFTKFRPIQKLG